MFYTTINIIKINARNITYRVRHGVLLLSRLTLQPPCIIAQYSYNGGCFIGGMVLRISTPVFPKLRTVAILSGSREIFILFKLFSLHF